MYFADSQNFLRRRALVDQLLAASSVRPGDLVLDLGAGTGLITERLAERGCRVVAVEQDPALAAGLRARFGANPNVRVLHLDILELRLPCESYSVFANIPFQATSAIVQRLTCAARPPKDAYLVVQREAAERFVGRPRGTLVAALLAPWFEATLVHRFRRTDFAPVPRVEAVMLRLRKRGPPLVKPDGADLFRDFVVCLFTARQRALAGRLGRLLGRRRARLLMQRLGLAEGATPATVSPLQWVDLFAAFQRTGEPPAQARVHGAAQRLHSQQRRLRKLHRTRTRRLDRPRHRLRWAQRGGLDSACRPPPRLRRRRATMLGCLCALSR